MRRAAETRGGFTLIEMLAVILILGLLASIAVPNLRSLSGRTLQHRAEVLAAQLELARQRALATGIPHRLAIDLDGGGYWMEWLVSESEASGEAFLEEPPEPEPLELRGNTPIPMTPPPQEERSYRPLPGALGRAVWLEDSLAFVGLESEEGWIQRGEVFISFQRDGTASYASLFLDDENGRTLVLDVLPLADSVRIGDAEG